jgi:hypothetical protein
LYMMTTKIIVVNKYNKLSIHYPNRIGCYWRDQVASAPKIDVLVELLPAEGLLGAARRYRTRLVLCRVRMDGEKQWSTGRWLSLF